MNKFVKARKNLVAINRGALPKEAQSKQVLLVNKLTRKINGSYPSFSEKMLEDELRAIREIIQKEDLDFFKKTGKILIRE